MKHSAKRIQNHARLLQVLNPLIISGKTKEQIFEKKNYKEAILTLVSLLASISGHSKFSA